MLLLIVAMKICFGRARSYQRARRAMQAEVSAKIEG